MSEAGPQVRPEPFVSFVIPVFNEEAVLPALLPRLRAVMDRLAGGAEAVFVSDGSDDASFELLSAAAAEDDRIRVVELTRNFGHPVALSAGLDHARGDAVVVMDADLQDPPELVPELVARYREGFEVVHARRSARLGESALKRATARVFYYLMGRLSSHPPLAGVGEFRLLGRPAVAALRRFPERHRLVRGMVAWLGFPEAVVDFERPPRAAGTSKYPLGRMLSLGLDGMTGFSVAPLRLAAFVGLAVFLAGVALAAWALRGALAAEPSLSGWVVVAALQVVSLGLTLFFLGVLGEYLGRVFEQVKGRPLYVVRRRVDVAPAAGAEPERGV